jgi:pimeloyl-ACP methyl ester carboxylesterase
MSTRAVLVSSWLLVSVACRPAPSGHPQAALPVETGTVVAADGVSISYDVRGSGRTALVFVHCWTCNRDYYREQLDRFASRYRVVSLDLAGHGASGKNRAAWSVLGFAGDVQAVIEKLGLERVILVGHSMGGPVSLEVARRLPNRVRGIVCLDTLHNAEQKMPPQMVERVTAAFRKDFRGTVGSFVRGMFPSSPNATVVSWVAEQASKMDPEIAIALFRDFPNLDLPRLMASVKVPLRCVNAAPRPPYGPPTASAVNRKYIDFAAAILDGVGHFLQLERPDEVNAKIRGFLEELDR